mmetsp:Transcript_90803/g.271061  ORF Transcript_90803/g.271061 Transcript_90803/m.271061 type:complete len:119 (-) Transcript_90803:79-435(-)
MAATWRCGLWLLAVALLQASPLIVQAEELVDAGGAQGAGKTGCQVPGDAMVLVQSLALGDQALLPAHNQTAHDHGETLGTYFTTVNQISHRLYGCVYWIPIIIFITTPMLFIASYFWK